MVVSLNAKWEEKRHLHTQTSLPIIPFSVFAFKWKGIITVLNIDFERAGFIRFAMLLQMWKVESVV